jgi:hypothetical protein
MSIGVHFIDHGFDFSLDPLSQGLQDLLAWSMMPSLDRLSSCQMLHQCT